MMNGAGSATRPEDAYPVLRSKWIKAVEDVRGWWSFSYLEGTVDQSVVDACKQAISELNRGKTEREVRDRLEAEYGKIIEENDAAHERELETTYAENRAELRQIKRAWNKFATAAWDDDLDEMLHAEAELDLLLADVDLDETGPLPDEQLVINKRGPSAPDKTFTQIIADAFAGGGKPSWAIFDEKGPFGLHMGIDLGHESDVTVSAPITKIEPLRPSAFIYDDLGPVLPGDRLRREAPRPVTQREIAQAAQELAKPKTRTDYLNEMRARMAPISGRVDTLAEASLKSSQRELLNTTIKALCTLRDHT